MMWVLVTLMVALQPMQLHGEMFNCTSSQPCSSIICSNPAEDCIIHCSNDNSCIGINITINSSPTYTFTLTCIGTNACKQVELTSYRQGIILCKESSSSSCQDGYFKVINKIGKKETVTSSITCDFGTCYNATFYCDDDDECKFDCPNGNGCDSGINIFYCKNAHICNATGASDAWGGINGGTGKLYCEFESNKSDTSHDKYDKMKILQSGCDGDIIPNGWSVVSTSKDTVSLTAPAEVQVVNFTTGPTMERAKKSSVSGHFKAGIRKLLSETSSHEQIFTTNKTSNSFGIITLINNSYNSITSNTWQCDNDNWNSLCLYLTLFNSACAGIETITLTTKGVTLISGNTDPYFIFAVKNSVDTWDFISFLADWDGWVVIDYSEYGGVFVAPNCGSTNLLNTVDIFTIWSDYGSMTQGLDNRIPLSNYDLNNWQRLTETRLGDATDPIVITIENDMVLNTVNVKFAENSIGSVNCTFNQAFDTFESGNDWIVLVMSDAGIVSYSEFIIDKECSVPVTLPTNISSVPTDLPSMSPTMNPGRTPTDTPSNSPTDSPIILPSAAPSNIPSATPSQTPSLSPSSLPSNTPSSVPTRMYCQFNVYFFFLVA